MAENKVSEGESGVQVMCKAMEDMRNETAEQVIIQTIRNLMETLRMTSEEVMEAMKISDTDREKYRKKL